MATFIKDTQAAIEVLVSAERTFVNKLKVEAELAQKQLGARISTSINSGSLKTALSIMDAKNNFLGASINIKNIKLKDLTKPKQLLSKLSTKSIKWNLNGSYSTAFGKIYVDVENGNPSIDLKSQIGNTNIAKIGYSNSTGLKLNVTTNRLDIIAEQVYGSPKFWWMVRCSNIKNLKTPFSKIRANSEINLVSKNAALNNLRGNYKA